MARRNSAPPVEVLRRSRKIREQAAEQQKVVSVSKAACLRQHKRSSELCRRSDDLVCKSRDLRQKLRNLRHAS